MSAPDARGEEEPSGFAVRRRFQMNVYRATGDDARLVNLSLTWEEAEALASAQGPDINDLAGSEQTLSRLEFYIEKIQP